MNLEPISISQQQQDDYKLGLNFFFFFCKKRALLRRWEWKKEKQKFPTGADLLMLLSSNSCFLTLAYECN